MPVHTFPNEGLTNDWLTPPYIIEALGPFGLDPCASVNQPWPTADTMWTEPDDGFGRSWDGYGLIWLNPPYGNQTWHWVHKLSEAESPGIALTFARVETTGFFEAVWKKADALLFLEGRLFFHHPVTGKRAKGNSGGASVLAGYGTEAVSRIRNSGLEGILITEWDHVG